MAERDGPHPEPTWIPIVVRCNDSAHARSRVFAEYVRAMDGPGPYDTGSQWREVWPAAHSTFARVEAWGEKLRARGVDPDRMGDKAPKSRWTAPANLGPRSVVVHGRCDPVDESTERGWAHPIDSDIGRHLDSMIDRAEWNAWDVAHGLTPRWPEVAGVPAVAHRHYQKRCLAPCHQELRAPWPDVVRVFDTLAANAASLERDAKITITLAALRKRLERHAQ